MKTYLRLLMVLVVMLGLIGCPAKSKQEGSDAAQGTHKKSNKVNQIKPVLVSEEKLKPEYVMTGVRDPFQIYIFAKPPDASSIDKVTDPLQKISLSQVELVGVITGNDPRAIVQDNSSTGYIIKEGTLIGENSGIVTNISSQGVTIKQHFKDYMGRVNTREIVLSLRKEEGER